MRYTHTVMKYAADPRFKATEGTNHALRVAVVGRLPSDTATLQF